MRSETTRRVVIEPEFAAWRAAARALLEAETPPEGIAWTERGDAQLTLGGFEAEPAAPSRPAATSPARLRVPRRFLELAEAASCHRSRGRWGLLYRVLWRIAHGEAELPEAAADPDVHRLLRMERAVRRDAHRMKALVRFRAVADAAGRAHVAWHEPEHHVVRRTAPFFRERFPERRWSILTPDRCAHWDGRRLRFSEGVPRASAPEPEALEGLWRTYCAHVFHSARPRTVRPEA